MKKINELIIYIQDSQQINGSFLLCDLTGKCYESPLVTAMVLNTLCGLGSYDAVEVVKKKAAVFLMSCGDDWMFSAVNKNSDEDFLTSKNLEVTFLVLSSLTRYSPEIFDGKAIAAILKILTDNEVDEGGPYYIGTEKHANLDISCIANIYIRDYLALNDVNLPKLDLYIEETFKKIINNPNLESEGIYAAYFLSGNCRKELGDLILRRLKPIFDRQKKDSPMMLMLINTMIRLGQSVEQLKGASDYLLCLENYEFENTYLMIGISDAKTSRSLRFSSGAINASMFLEVLDSLVDITNTGKGDDNSDEEEFFHGLIVNKARRGFERVNVDLRKFCDSILDKILSFDGDRQIVLLSYKFKKAIGESGKDISDEVIEDLGVANLYIWMAYTIYDDFLDDEGDVRFLSVANFCLREFACVYGRLMLMNDEFRVIFNQIMDQLDSANAWEVTHARTLVSGDIFHIPEEIPDYHDFSKLAERSLAHGLGPVAILAWLGYKHDSLEIKNLLDFFKHYLVARQLNDDAHDWEEDMRRGHIDAVVSLILKKIIETEGQKGEIDLGNDFASIQKDFWFKMIPEISEMVLLNINQARHSLVKISLVEEPEHLFEFLIKTENAAIKAIREHKQAMEFLENYQR